MTLAQLAESAGVSRTHLWNLSTGRASVTVDVLAKLGAALEVDPVSFLRPRSPDLHRRRSRRDEIDEPTQIGMLERPAIDAPDIAALPKRMVLDPVERVVTVPRVIKTETNGTDDLDFFGPEDVAVGVAERRPSSQ